LFEHLSSSIAWRVMTETVLRRHIVFCDS